MARHDVTVKIEFKHSGEECETRLKQLIETAVSFLDLLATKQLTNPEFFEIIKEGTGSEKFSKLLSACNFADNPEAFFHDLLEQLSLADGSGQIDVNGIIMPHLLLGRNPRGFASRPWIYIYQNGRGIGKGCKSEGPRK